MIAMRAGTLGVEVLLDEPCPLVDGFVLDLKLPGNYPRNEKYVGDHFGLTFRITFNNLYRMFSLILF